MALNFWLLGQTLSGEVSSIWGFPNQHEAHQVTHELQNEIFHLRRVGGERHSFRRHRSRAPSKVAAQLRLTLCRTCSERAGNHYPYR